MSPREGQRPACSHCGKRPRELRKGYCRTTCYARWERAGFPPEGPKPDQIEQWRQLPVLPPFREPTDMGIGSAGEHLVCADLLLGGYTAFRTDQGCPYDVALDLGQRLVRLQVKTTRAPTATTGTKKAAYSWHVRRGHRDGRLQYPEGSFDLLALVAIDIRQVAYMRPSTDRALARIRPPGTESSLRFSAQFSDFPLGRALSYVLSYPVPDAMSAAAGEGGER